MTNPVEGLADAIPKIIDNVFEGLWGLDGKQWGRLVSILLVGGAVVMFLWWWLLTPSR